MGDPVEEGCGHLSVTEDLRPLTEGQVGLLEIEGGAATKLFDFFRTITVGSRADRGLADVVLSSERRG